MRENARVAPLNSVVGSSHGDGSTAGAGSGGGVSSHGEASAAGAGGDGGVGVGDGSVGIRCSSSKFIIGKARVDESPAGAAGCSSHGDGSTSGAGAAAAGGGGGGGAALAIRCSSSKLMLGKARVSPPVPAGDSSQGDGSGAGGAGSGGDGSGVSPVMRCSSSKLMLAKARVSPPAGGAAPKMSLPCSWKPGASVSRSASAGVNTPVVSCSDSGMAGCGAVGTVERACSISSSTLWMRLCDSNGLVTTASQPALSARSGSKGSNVPVSRTTGMVR